MTLIELMLVLVLIAFGTGLARLLHPVGGFWLSVPGFIVGFLFLPGLVFGYSRCRAWAYCGDEAMSPCSCGAKGPSKEHVGKAPFTWSCPFCGKQYEKRKNEVYVLEGEKRLPYMHLVKHRGWIEMDTPDRTGSDT